MFTAIRRLGSKNKKQYAKTAISTTRFTDWKKYRTNIFSALADKQKQLLAKPNACPLWFTAEQNGDDRYRKTVKALVTAAVKRSKNPRAAFPEQLISNGFAQFAANVYLKSNAHKIGSDYIANTGPQRHSADDNEQVCQFLDDLVSNGQADGVVVSLGHSYSDFKREANKPHDFWDFGKPQSYTSKAGIVYTVEEPNQTDEKAHTVHTRHLTVTIKRPGQAPVTKKLEKHDVSIDDGRPIVINESNVHEFYALYKQSGDKPLDIHCAAGEGRTGHLILTFLLVDYFQEVFGTEDDANHLETSANIIKIIAYIRSFRAGAVTGQDQITQAIQNAVVLYDHEQKNVPPDQQKNLTALPSFNKLIQDIDPTVAEWMDVTPRFQHKLSEDITTLDNFDILPVKFKEQVGQLCSNLFEKFAQSCLTYQYTVEAQRIYSLREQTNHLTSAMIRFTQQPDSETNQLLSSILEKFTNSISENPICRQVIKQSSGQVCQNEIAKLMIAIAKNCQDTAKSFSTPTIVAAPLATAPALTYR